MNKIDLNGRVAVVTGGAQGFGRAITERFISSGAKVAIWDHDLPFAEKPQKKSAPASPPSRSMCRISPRWSRPATPRWPRSARSTSS